AAPGRQRYPSPQGTAPAAPRGRPRYAGLPTSRTRPATRGTLPAPSGRATPGWRIPLAPLAPAARPGPAPRFQATHAFTTTPRRRPSARATESTVVSTPDPGSGGRQRLAFQQSANSAAT